jgi:hypothetical protein
VVAGEGLADRPIPEHERPFVPDAAFDGRWVNAVDMRPNDLLKLRDGRVITLHQIARREFHGPVYNYRVSELHTYAVGNSEVLVHNNDYTTRSAKPRVVEKIADNAEQRIIRNGLTGNIDEAMEAAEDGREILPGLFKYQDYDNIPGYAQHHLWPQAMGGPREGWIAYALQPHNTVEGVQGRLNSFLRGQTGLAQRELEEWARNNPDKILPFLRKFYKGEGVDFPY